MDTGSHATLVRRSRDGVAWWTDPTQPGVVIAFTERAGGVSAAPYRSLNLAAHVGDDPDAVDANRDKLLSALGVPDLRGRLTVAEQVHGACVTLVTDEEAGRGGSARVGPGPVPASDALVTVERGLPLLLCFADCVPVVLLAPGPGVAVVHAGWRGALAGIAGVAVAALADSAACGPDEIRAYIGPRIGACHYPVSEELLSQFEGTFGTFARAESGGLDLGSVVAADLARSGVGTCRIALLDACTAEQTDQFFSYRAEGGRTGRHGALACIL